MAIMNHIKNAYEKKMQKSLELLQVELAKIHTGRVYPGFLDHIQVFYHDSTMKVNQVANIVIVDSRTIGVRVWEKNMVPIVEKAIRESGLGLNPVVMSDMIRVQMPILTEERRRDFVKIVKTEAENARISVRNIRRDGNNELKTLLKDKNITEDDERRGQDAMQKLTDKYIAEIDKMLAKKEADLLAV